MNVCPGVASAVTRIRPPTSTTCPSATGGAGEGHVVLAIDEVLGTGSLREREAAGDVVVVDVGLEDVREVQAVLV